MPMNRAEALEKYGAREVKFASYYKYGFTFTSGPLTVSVGGDPSDIYYFDVNADETYTVADIIEGFAVVSIEEDDELVFEEDW